MEIWITRSETGVLIQKYTPPDGIEKELRDLEVYPKLTPKEEVKVELTGRWREIKQLFGDIQFLADRLRERDFEKGGVFDKLLKRLAEQKLIKI